MSSDGKRIFFISSRLVNVWAVSLENGTEYPVTDLTDRPGRLGQLATHGESLYFPWTDSYVDLWVMDVVNE